MKKAICLLLVFALTFITATPSFANNNVEYNNYSQLTCEIANKLKVDSNGKIDIEETLLLVQINRYNESDLQKANTFLSEFNKELDRNNLFIDNNLIIRERNPKNNLSMTRSSDKQRKLIVAGAYDIGNNYRRLYFTRSQAEKMIKNRAHLTEAAFWAGLLGGWASVPAGIIIALTGYVSDVEHDTWVEQLNKSGNHGIYCEYWRYNTGSKIWGPWYAGEYADPDWIKL